MLQRNNKNLLERLQNAKFHLLQKEFDRKMENQARYYRNYIAAFEILLLFIRASRQQSWGLHLEALNEMVPYFFAFDMFNYARLTPVYLSQMTELKEKDNDTGQAFQAEHFSLNKSSVPFSAIGADHALEQQNRAMKVLGGIKGIANSQTALDEYFMTAEELSLLLDQFSDQYDLRNNSLKRKQHYQLSGSKNQRITDNTEKLTEILNHHNISFNSTEPLYNVITNKVIRKDQAMKFLNAVYTCKDKLDLFIKERLIGEKSISDTITKEKIPTLVFNNKEITITVNKELMNLKEERKLMSRFLVALRSRLILIYRTTWVNSSSQLFLDRSLR